MLTTSLITFIQSDFPDWSEVRILSLINEIQRIVFTQVPTDQMRMFDTLTGKDPILTTESGTLVYNINTSAPASFPYNAWRIWEVYQTDINDPEDVFTIDATPVTNCAQIVFKEDPGITDFYVRCYRFPTVLSSNSVQLEIPHQYHLTHVYEGVAGLIEKSRSGKSERWNMFEQKLLPELVKKLSEGRRRSTDTPYRICGL